MSERRNVHNPLLGLTAMQELSTYLHTQPDVQAHIITLLMQLGNQANEQATYCWHKHKAPMAAYWKAVAVYARHTAKALKRQGGRA